MCGSGRRDPGLRIKSEKIDPMAGLLSQLLEIEQLTTAVPFAERMHIVDVTNDFAGGQRKSREAQATQEIAKGKPAMDIAHTGFNEAAELKLVSALGDLDAAQHASPIKDILKQVPVDGLQMQQIEVPGGDAFTDPLRNQGTFEGFELSLVSESRLVPEHRRSRVKVRIIVAHSAASGLALARM
jgi:hypothetical protein